MDSVRELILRRLAALHLTMTDASVRMGRNAAYLQQFIKRGVPTTLHEQDRARLAQILQVDEGQLRSVVQPVSKLEKRVGNIHRKMVISPEQNLLEVMRSNGIIQGEELPIYGATESGTFVILTATPIDRTVRPLMLARVQDAYGVLVVEDSMSPELKQGSTALIHPHLPPRPGDTCLFRKEKDGKTFVQLGVLRRVNDKTWFVHQHSSKRDHELSRAEWQIAHRVVASLFPA